MEGREVYIKSYNYMGQLLAHLQDDSITIDYTKLDTNSKGEVKKVITNVLYEIRKDNNRDLSKKNCTDSVTIEFDKLDDETKEKLRKFLLNTIAGRRLCIGNIIFQAE